MTKAPCVLPNTGMSSSFWIAGALLCVVAGVVISRLPRRHRLSAVVALLLPLSVLVSRAPSAEAASKDCATATTKAPVKTTTTTAAPTTTTAAPNTTTTVAPTTTTTVAPSTTSSTTSTSTSSTSSTTSTTVAPFTVTIRTENGASVTSTVGTGYDATSGTAPGGTQITISGLFNEFLEGPTGGICSSPDDMSSSNVITCTITGNFALTLNLVV